MAPQAKILLLGESGAGKSTFINAAAGKEVAKVGHSLQSCTSKTSAFTLTHPNKPGCEVVLIDTPGFDDSWAEDKEILARIVEWLKTTRTAPTGIIYLHVISHWQMHGSLGGFSDAIAMNVVKLSNHMIAQSIVLVTTKWEYCRDKSAGDRRQEEPRNEWQGMLEHGLKVVRFADSQKSAWEIIDYFINNGPSSSEAIQVELERLLKDTFKTPNPRGRFKGREGDTPKPAEIIAARTPEDADVPLPDNQGEPPRSPSLSSSILNLPPARSSKPPSPVVANHETRRPTFDNMASEGEPPRSPSLSSTRNVTSMFSNFPPDQANRHLPFWRIMRLEGQVLTAWHRRENRQGVHHCLPLGMYAIFKQHIKTKGDHKPPPPVLANHETRRPRFDSMASEGEPPRSPLDSILNLPATSQPYDRAPEYVRGQAATADPREEQARTSEAVTPVTPATPTSQNIWDFEEAGESERRSSERKPSFDVNLTLRIRVNDTQAHW
ncbi:P-loop containing nucleoside triphosphate hydrolase protein [Hygrophoropsis aurantiaca]|uniref:P-loop containing nucleoside triphosphate hydrolase protein n=1 Tax=Hygrophoropsis aurantiaca TaxID=72124 RepID=A0ACB8AE97_9AGAM|nr:P-loop containing nucleoside triphosphate hydrolase protein [Hygrophoropsis aurantiaca]